MYESSAGTKKSGRCREVAAVEMCLLVEVQLYIRYCVLFYVNTLVVKTSIHDGFMQTMAR